MKINSFDLNLLVVFRALFEERNVTKASKKIGITQPAMSNALNRLRYLVKDELFIRGPKGMRPTPRALELSVPIHSSLTNIELSLNSKDFNPSKTKKLFRISISDDIAPLILPNLVREMEKISTNFSLCARSAQGLEAIKLLDKNEIDFSLGRFESVPNRFGVRVLFDERYVCMMNKRHPLSVEKKLSMEQYLSSSHLRVAPMDAPISPIDRALDRLNLERIISVRVDLITISPFILNNSEIILTLPSKTAKRIANDNDFKVVELPVELEKRQTKIIWHKELTNHPAYDWIKQKPFI
mgnify:CR=1 FL=1